MSARATSNTLLTRVYSISTQGECPPSISMLPRLTTTLSHNSLTIRLTGLIDNWSGVQQVNSPRGNGTRNLIGARTHLESHIRRAFALHKICLRSAAYLRDVQDRLRFYRDSREVITNRMGYSKSYLGTRRGRYAILREFFFLPSIIMPRDLRKKLETTLKTFMQYVISLWDRYGIRYSHTF